MAIYRDEVAILKAHDVGEFDKILDLFGKRQGRFRAIAKGIRRLSSRKRGHLETFNLCRVSCAEGKNLDLVVESESYFCIDPKILGVSEYENLGFAGMVLNKLLPENVSESGVFEKWEKYIQGELNILRTNAFVIFVLDTMGFVSPTQLNLWSGHLSEEATLKSIRNWVSKVLDTA